MLCLAGISFSLAEEITPLLGYQPPDSADDKSAVLYFRYMGSGWLGQEVRDVSVPRTDNMEKALVQALLDGPSIRSPHFRPLFPPGTQVLSVLEEGGRLFVTFNERLLDPLAGEEAETEGSDNAPSLLRRRLAMASLVNTLTESGEYSSVQVLVLGQPNAAGSMRLSARYYLEDRDSLLDPLKRQEEWIVTPGLAAGLILSTWQSQFFSQLKLFVTRENAQWRPEEASLDIEKLPGLLSYHVSGGSVSPDGSYAVLTVDARMAGQDGMQRDVSGYPLRLVRQDGIWKMSETSLLLLTGEVR